jgi:hypothetical protein
MTSSCLHYLDELQVLEVKECLVNGVRMLDYLWSIDIDKKTVFFANDWILIIYKRDWSVVLQAHAAW